MKFVIILLVVLLCYIQFRLWAGDGGVPEVLQREDELAAHQQQAEAAEQRNRKLRAEVTDLKTGLEAIEERARSELGMIGPDETFYQIIETPDTNRQQDEQ